VTSGQPEHLWRWLALALVFVPILAFAGSKTIRLRNEPITTPEKTQRAAEKKSNVPSGGLFLLQLDGPMQTAWAEELTRRGVSLVRYVPDDAWIARAKGADLDALEQLPFVRWTGPFRPEHKVLGSLKNKLAGDELPVSVLLAPDSSPQQLATARGLMKRMGSQSTTRFGHVWRGAVSRGQLNALAASDAVLWIERGPQIKLFDETASKIVGGESSGHATFVQSLGYDGSGAVVSVADSGLHLGEAQVMHPDLFGRVDAFLWYGDLSDASDEHSHGTHVTGIVAGNGATGLTDDFGALWGLGVAPGAHIVVQRLFDGEGGYAPEFDPTFTFERLTRDAKEAGADIGSNSWGDDTQGRYDISAAEFDALVRDANGIEPGDQPYILEFSAGNAGPGAQTIGSPAVAKNVIATGASQNNRFDFFIYDVGQEAMADFSSRGPAEDGRIKPDVVAPGTWIASLRSPIGNDEFAWSDIDGNYYLFQGGTSQAGPHVSGAAAALVQWYRESHTNATPSPALVKATLINSAADMDDNIDTEPVPNHDEGWGRVDLAEIMGGERIFDFVDQAITLSTGQTFERAVVLADDTLPLFVTLAYTDVPGFPGAVPALVNDLDLEVVAPDGRLYRGNQFLDGESVADSPSADRLNNVECVFIGVPLAGQYLVRVRARNVPQDARVDTGAVDQDFALVASANLAAPGTGFVFFDRRAYTVPGTIQAKVVDTDLQGQPSVNLTVRSTSQPSGVALTLRPSNLPGTFTGSVATATTTIAGRLRIAHNDSITADYFDASSSTLRTATARADLIPPVISGVGTSNSFGKTFVFWNTDEPANSTVRYNTNTSLTLTKSDGFYRTDHSVALTELLPGRTYFFAVVSEDEAGNRATNNNGGALFSFVAPRPATVLLVNNYQNDEFGAGPDIPLSTYTDALNATGVSYDLWNMAQGAPSPTATDLQPYRVVIWRVSDNVFLDTTLTAAEQTAVRDYLRGGGAFFMASMEQLTRLSGNFRSDVLHVTSFAEDATAPAAIGITGNPVSSGLDLSLDYSAYDTETYQLFGVPADISDTMTPSGEAFPILLEPSDEIVGLAYPRAGLDRTGRVVYLSFPFDAISASAPAPNNRATLMQRVLDFLAPGREGVGSISLDNTEYTLPSLAFVEVGDADLAGAGQVAVTISNVTLSIGRTLTLTEFGRFGVFRGSLAFVATNSATPTNELRARNGDVILASYFDASLNASVTYTARVETVPPVISDIVFEPGYVDAFVSWTTSEPADALVQFGESTFLGRTAYVPTLGFAHELTLDALQPEHLYYYRVVSRDNAGNVAIYPADGSLLTFTTLAPFHPPWFDDLESGDANWFVYQVEDSEMDWRYGVPQNGVTAHSGSRVWASNLNGDPVSFVESFLISPPIYLTDGNRATLRFWQNYEFNEGEDDLIHLGEVAIITNTSAAPITLDVLEGFESFGWEEAEYDLTPYVGNLVYLVWHYAFFSFDTGPRQGWVIDDISVTMSNVVAGTLRVTNNLSQASFVISGPLNLAAQGNLFVTTNAPPGDYTVTWQTNAHYQTLAPQNGTVTALATTTFTGTYTMIDTNNNGMADSWERTYFGSASAGRTEFTDTDGDGMTDSNEFLAGTNPTNALSYFRFLTPAVQNTGAVRFDWPSVPGRSYRISSAGPSLLDWAPATDWMRANGTVLSFTTNVTDGTRFYRLEVRP